MYFSLRILLLAVAITALCVSGFVFNVPWVGSLAYTLCMSILLLAALAAFFVQGHRRFFWAGFAAFGWGYWFLGFETVEIEQSRLSATRPVSRFVTSDVIDALERLRGFSRREGSRLLVEWQGAYWPATVIHAQPDKLLMDWGDGSSRFWADASQILPFSDGSRSAAHSLFCLLFAVAGAFTAVWLVRDGASSQAGLSNAER
jgi:hypothetical protein